MLICQKVIPILRMFDLAKTQEFYVDWLGFKIDWQHKYGEDFPVYMQLSLGDLILHMSEHHGDGSPNARVYVVAENPREYHAELSRKNYKYNKPGYDEESNCFCVIDPCGNIISFNAPR